MFAGLRALLTSSSSGPDHDHKYHRDSWGDGEYQGTEYLQSFILFIIIKHNYIY